MHASHVLAKAGDFLYCTKCGFYVRVDGQQRSVAQKLAAECKRLCTTASSSYLKRLSKGWAPVARYDGRKLRG